MLWHDNDLRRSGDPSPHFRARGPVSERPDAATARPAVNQSMTCVAFAALADRRARGRLVFSPLRRQLAEPRPCCGADPAQRP